MSVDALLDAVAEGLVISGGALALGALGDTLGGVVGLRVAGRGDLLDISVSHLVMIMLSHSFTLLFSSHAVQVKDEERGVSESKTHGIKTYRNAVSLAVDVALVAGVVTSQL